MNRTKKKFSRQILIDMLSSADASTYNRILHLQQKNYMNAMYKRSMYIIHTLPYNVKHIFNICKLDATINAINKIYAYVYTR